VHDELSRPQRLAAAAYVYIVLCTVVLSRQWI
jgi:hypothetical protein